MAASFASSNPAPPTATQITLQEFNTYKEELSQRVQVVASGLGSIGMRSAQLNTQQLIEMLYNIYNPEESNKQKLTDFEHLTTPVVKSELEKKDESTPATNQ